MPEAATAFLRETAIVLKPGEGFSDKLPESRTRPLDRGGRARVLRRRLRVRPGLETPLNSYRTLDLDWELLAPWAGVPLDVPAIFIGGEHDLPAIWGIDAVERLPEVATKPHEPAILEGLGHWNFQEDPAKFNAALVGFLEDVKPTG